MLTTTAMAALPVRTSRKHVTSDPARFLIAAGTSTYGDWLSTIALVVLMFRLTGGVMGPALYILVRVAPRLLGPTLGGALADRHGAAHLAARCALVQALFTAAVIPLALGGVVWAIYVVVAVAQLTGSMAQPACSAVIPRLARPEHLRRINAIYSGLQESSVLIAPAVGALLLTRTSPLVLIGLDAGSFVVAASLLNTLRLPAAAAAPHRGRQVLAGLQVVRREPLLRMLAAGHLCSGVLVTALQTVLVVAAGERFGHDVAVGWLYAAVGAGGVSGSVAAMRWRLRCPSPRILFAGVLLEVVPLAMFAVTSHLVLDLGLLFVSTFAGALYQTIGAVALQERVPTELLGRVNGAIRQALYCGMVLGAVGAALLAQVMGWAPMLLIMSVVSMLLLVVTGVSPRHGTARRPRREYTLRTAPAGS